MKRLKRLKILIRHAFMFAKAELSKDGAYCAITSLQRESIHYIAQKGINAGVLSGIETALKQYLEALNNDGAKLYREEIMKVLAEDEQRRLRCDTEQEASE